PNSEAGRVSQAFAYMLYAEMVMYQNDTQRYAKALDFMKKIASSGDYSLNPDYAAIWEESGEWCSESIFEINYDDNGCQRDWGTSMFVGGSVLPTLISPNGYNGDDWSGLDGWGFLPMRVRTYEMFEEGDVRRDATCWDLRGESYTERYQDTHIWLKKYRPTNENCKDCGTSKNLNYNNNKRIYRFAETLLNIAELTLATGGNTGEALNNLNQVRVRAGLNGYNECTIDNILNERHLEFCGEGKRYFDLVRTGYASTVLVPYAEEHGRTNTWTPSKKYIPLAQSELDADPTLKQNDY
ncbi:MAG: RagB/SusD family nutrient uptake outer membrane protein, partial [Bacteroidales bacterium]|nr:RagB/SusD family nutrient uptake outer membrane protein [Bacteroidales bacterium]